MEHSEAIQLMAAEKYLLDELPADERDEFEEHLFGCHECAMDMRTASVLLEQGKAALAEPEVATARGREKEKSRPGFFGWLRPAFAVPAMAALLLVIGYQNLVTLPQLTRSVNKPQLLPAITVHLLTYGTDDASPLMVHRGQGFLLNVIAPPDRRYPAYEADLRSPAGGVESVAISASADDTWPIQFPGANRQSGKYQVTVNGVTAGGQSVEVGKAIFQLQVQQ